MEDEIITVNKQDFSIRKILGEDGWQTYQKTSDKVRNIVRLKIRLDLSAMEIGFARLNALTSNSANAKTNKDLTDFQKENPKSASQTSLNPNIMFNSRVSSQKLGATDTALYSPSLNKVKQNLKN